MLASVLIAFVQPALGEETAGDQRSPKMVSVFDGDVLVTHLALPKDATLSARGESIRSNDQTHVAMLVGNVTLVVKQQGRQILSLSGDRMLIEDEVTSAESLEPGNSPGSLQ